MKLNWLNINSLPTPVLENARLMQELRDLRQDYKNLEEWNYNTEYREWFLIILEKQKEEIKRRIEELV
jgi:hypothetical protein